MWILSAIKIKITESWKLRLQLYIIQYILVYTTKSKINKVNVEALNLTNWFLCFVRKQKPFEYVCYHWGSSDKEKRLGFIIFEVPSPVYDVKWIFRRHYHDIYALCSPILMLLGRRVTLLENITTTATISPLGPILMDNFQLGQLKCSFGVVAWNNRVQVPAQIVPCYNGSII